MNITNKYNLPSTLVEAAKNIFEQYDRVGDLSVTDLIKPTQVLWLERRHDKQIEIDVMDLRHALLGTAMHHIFEKASPISSIAEQRFIIPFDGVQISMKPDLLDIVGLEEAGECAILMDYKICKAYAIRGGQVKPEWFYQLNMYAYGLRKRGIDVSKIILVAWIKDWNYIESIKDNRYPKHGIIQLNVPMMGQAQVESYIRKRIQTHWQHKETPDELLPECSMDERWGSPDRYAVKKVGGKNALPNATFLTAREADTYIKERTEKDGTLCEKKFCAGESKRCCGAGDWSGCPVRSFCQQWLTKINPPF